MELHEALSSAFDKLEEPAPVVVDAVEPVESVEPVVEAKTDDRPRDEAGRFAPKIETPPEVPPEPVINRPTTWKKEYWPLYDKLATGQPLNADEAKKLAEYTNQRENEFKSGVSTYKAEADKAREIQDAVAPFLPELQRYNIAPGTWITNLGRAHQTLAMGSPQQKLEMFKRLAAEYGVPMQMPEGQPDPQVNWMSQRLQTTEERLNKFETAQQRAEENAMQAQIASVRDEKDPSGKPLRPHWDTVRDQMAGLLQSGMAQNLADAYTKATRLNDQLWEQQRSLAAPALNQAAVIAKAKAAAISPRSASPSTTGDAKPKGLRAILESQFEAGGRV
jgi:hypothetical protein